MPAYRLEKLLEKLVRTDEGLADTGRGAGARNNEPRLGVGKPASWHVDRRVRRDRCRRAATLLTVRFILHPPTLVRDLADPVVGGVAPTYAMGWMLISLSVWKVSHLGWALLWLFSLSVRVIFLWVFAKHQLARFELSRMVPSWFVPPVGVIVAAVSDQTVFANCKVQSVRAGF